MKLSGRNLEWKLHHEIAFNHFPRKRIQFEQAYCTQNISLEHTNLFIKSNEFPSHVPCFKDINAEHQKKRLDLKEWSILMYNSVERKASWKWRCQTKINDNFFLQLLIGSKDRIGGASSFAVPIY